MEIPYLIVSGGLNLTINGEPYSINTSHPHYTEIIELLRARDFEPVLGLIDMGATIKEYTQGSVKIAGDDLFFEGTKLHSSLANHIVQMYEAGMPIEPLVKFLENLMQNPSYSSVEQFYRFVERNALTIDSDGFVIMYKGVTEDFKDQHTQTFDNSPGSVLEMPRGQVDDDRSRGCSKGFHAGSWEYVKTFGHIKLVVRINPRDVVSVPEDSNCTKVRVCRYEVLEQVGQFYHNSPVATDLTTWRIKVGIRHGSAKDAYLMVEHEVKAGTSAQARAAALNKTRQAFDGLTPISQSGLHRVSDLPVDLNFQWNKEGKRRRLKLIQIDPKQTVYRVMSANMVQGSKSSGQRVILVEYQDPRAYRYQREFKVDNKMSKQAGKSRALKMAENSLKNLFQDGTRADITQYRWKPVKSSPLYAEAESPDQLNRFKHRISIVE